MISITCACKSRLEVDEKFAGQTITCPDCQKPLSIPEPEMITVRTSGFALTSLILAIVGAFTILATVAAVVFGLLALWHIRRYPRRITGERYAVAGIVLGGVFTLMSIFLYAAPHLMGIDFLLRKSQWLGRLHYPPELEINRSREGYTIKRPSTTWGVLRDEQKYATDQFQHLLMVQPAKSAFVFCLVEEVGPTRDWIRFKEIALNRLKAMELDNGRIQFDLERVDINYPDFKTIKNADNGFLQAQEMVVVKKYRGKEKTYLVRLILNDAPIDAQNRKLLYIVAAGTDTAQFEEMQEEFRQALESYRVTGAPNRSLNANNWGP
jgi:hypothetical protein